MLRQELGVVEDVTLPLRLHTISGAGNPAASQLTSVSWLIQDLITVGPPIISGLSEGK